MLVSRVVAWGVGSPVPVPVPAGRPARTRVLAGVRVTWGGVGDGFCRAAGPGLVAADEDAAAGPAEAAARDRDAQDAGQHQDVSGGVQVEDVGAGGHGEGE